ncbi:hypothetical protein BGZ98_007732 [Dissophora globulifera]|nr:hypothetical protein BGZ98_007732 [Dissophora globulifera]
MSDNEHRKRGLEDSDNHDSDSDDRRHKRIAVPDASSDSQEKPLHRRRDEDVKMKVEGDDIDVAPSMPIRALVTMKEAGVIIGKSGKNVNEIREQSGAKVTISEIVPGAVERVLTITGPLDMVAKAYALVARKILEEQSDPETSTPDTDPAVVQLLVPHHLMGVVIGKSGSKIKEIQEESGARLQASEEMLPGSTERTVTVTGVPDSIHIAVYHVGVALQDKLNNERDTRQQTIQYRPMSRNSYGASSGYPVFGSPAPHHRHQQQSYYGGGGGSGAGYMHGPYGADYAPPSVSGGGAMTQAQQIFIPNDMVGTVIGKNGAKINEIRQMSGSHIKIADSAGAGNERLVTITGTPESNQMAVYLLYSRLESEKTR